MAALWRCSYWSDGLAACFCGPNCCAVSADLRPSASCSLCCIAGCVLHLLLRLLLHRRLLLLRSLPKASTAVAAA